MKSIGFILMILSVWTNLTLAQVSPTYLDAERFVTSKDSQIVDAMQLIRFGDSDGAILRLEKIVASEKTPKEALFLLGIAYRIKGNLTESINNFTKATSEDSYYLPAFFERGNCYLMRENFKLAVFDFDRVILIDSTFVPAYNNRAYARIRNYGSQEFPTYQLKFAKQDLSKAAHISQARGEAPRFETYFNIGLVDLFQSEYALASISFDTAILVRSDIAKAYYFRGAARFLNRDYELASEDFHQAENLGFEHPNTPEFLRIIALVEEHKRKLKSDE
jgi:tetratricopeptide (TPR) repeat protein